MSAKNRGAVKPAPNENEFFCTPAWCVRAILPQLPKRCRYLDVGCGTGEIGAVVALEGTPGGLVCGIEIDDGLANQARDIGLVVETGDFLKVPTNEWNDTQVVIANPPFSRAQEFVEKALELVTPNMGTVAMLLPMGFLASQKRVQFHKKHPSDCFVLSERPSFTRNGRTDAIDYAWFLWGPGRGNRWAHLETSHLVRESARDLILKIQSDRHERIAEELIPEPAESGTHMSDEADPE